MEIFSNEALEESIILPFSTPQVHEDVPANIQQLIRESSLCLQFSPQASAALARKGLEAVIRYRLSLNEVENLSKQLANLFDDLDTKPNDALKQKVWILKDLGNTGSHFKLNDVGLDIQITPDDADLAISVLIGLVQHYWVDLPKDQREIAALKSKFTERKNDGGK